MALPHNTQDVSNFITFGAVNTFKYKNHRGEIAMRRVIPLCLRFGVPEYHTTDMTGEWLLECVDCEKQSYRTFTLANILPR